MPRKNSLRLKKEISEIYKNGKFYHSKLFTIGAHQGQDEIKIAFIIKKKIIKKAYRRNYAKRILREIIRTKILSGKYSPYNLAITVKLDLYEMVKKEASITFKDISKELEEIILKVVS